MPTRRIHNDRRIIYCEGSDDKYFLCYLRSLYSTDSTNPTIRNGHGGSSLAVVKKMRGDVRQLAAYSGRAVLFDSDLGDKKTNKAKKEAAKRPVITPIISNRCFECEMLRISGVATQGIMKAAMADSARAKIEFAKICSKTTDVRDSKSYPSVYTRSLLDSKRHESAWLNSLIDFVTIN